MALAATTADRQAYVPPCLRTDHTRTLASDCVIQPHRTDHSTPRYLASLHETGADVIACAAIAVRTDDEVEAIKQAHSSVKALRITQRHWDRERLWIDITTIQARLAVVTRASRAEHGRLNAAWLPMCDIGTGEFLLTVDATELLQGQVIGLGGGSKLSQLITWRWEAAGTISFALVSVPYPLNNGQDAQFDLLINALLTNYPEITHRSMPSNILVVAGSVDLDYTFTVQQRQCTLNVFEWPDPQPIQRTIHTASQVNMWIRRRDKEAAVAYTPTLASVVQLFVRARPTRLRYGSVYRRLTHTEEEVGNSLFAEVEWPCIHNHPVATAAERLTMLRFKLGRVTLHASGHDGPICPHEACAPIQATISHVLWDCPPARTIWDAIWTRWQSLLEWNTRSDLQHAVLTWKPQKFPRKWRTNVATLQTCTPPPDPRRTLTTIWTAEVITAIHAIYRLRVALHEQGAATPAISEMFTRQLRRLTWTLQSQAYGAAARELFALMEAPQTLPCEPQHDQEWIFYFDGGARGNPGPGGAGSMLLRPYQSMFDISWIGSEYFTAPTTNNYAEFAALRNGVNAATTFGIQALHIIGDSQLIIHMHQSMRTPRAPHLCSLHDETVAAPDRIKTVTWHHHVREYNKMADRAANWAMDHGESSVSSHLYTTLHAQVCQHKAADLGHWSERGPQHIRSTS